MASDFQKFLRRISRLPKVRVKDGAALSVRVDNDAIQAVYSKYDADGEELVYDVVVTWRGRMMGAVTELLQMREDIQGEVHEV